MVDVFGGASVEEEGEANGDHRKRVWSSEPDMRSSGVVRRRASYRACASFCANVDMG